MPSPTSRPFHESRTGAGIGGASYSRGFIEPGSDFSQICLIVVSANCESIGTNSFAGTAHASRAAEVERSQSNLVAHFSGS
jgi:hypothetical protein